MSRIQIRTLVVGVVMASVTTNAACSDSLAPDAPVVQPPASDALAAVGAAEVPGAADDASDLTDLVERVVPAFGDRATAAKLEGALRQLADDTRAQNSVSADKALSRALAALDDVEAAAEEDRGADVAVIRMTLMARAQ